MSKKEKEEKVSEEVLEEVENTPAEEAPEEPNIEEELNAKLKEANDKYMRLYAEFDNYKKRTQKEKEQRYADAVIDVAAKILPIGDNLERALQTEVTSEDALKLKEGIDMVLKQFNDALSDIGVTPILAEGEQFDPVFHNAVMHIEDETIDDNTVVEDLMRGYKYKDNRVVRHSMVKVAN
ncbi:MAG: nucleotide exchange factor GrpE [Clostridia bacterium]|nr:nucleotide exchange factor GrpE [Clostridia bacterium]